MLEKKQGNFSHVILCSGLVLAHLGYKVIFLSIVQTINNLLQTKIIYGKISSLVPGMQMFAHYPITCLSKPFPFDF